MNADVSLNATYPARSTDPPAYRAIGVEYKQHGELKRAFLKNALIPEKLQAHFDATSRDYFDGRSAQHPLLLMKSGIGPQADLAAAGIEAKVISEGVGRNLQDHPTVAVLATLDADLASSLTPGSSLLSSLPGYVGAVEHSQRYETTMSDDGESKKTNPALQEADFGLLGTSGFSAGAFVLANCHG